MYLRVIIERLNPELVAFCNKTGFTSYDTVVCTLIFMDCMGESYETTFNIIHGVVAAYLYKPCQCVIFVA